MTQAQYAELVAERDGLRAENADLHKIIETQRAMIEDYGAGVDDLGADLIAPLVGATIQEA
jgi:hypothetical protein